MRYTVLTLAFAAVSVARPTDSEERRPLDWLEKLRNSFQQQSPPAAPKSSIIPSAVASALGSAQASPVLLVDAAAAAPGRVFGGVQPSPSSTRRVFGGMPSSAAPPRASSVVVLPPVSSAKPHVASSAVAAAPSASALVRPPAAYIQTVLDHHNAHRSNHSAPALTWSDTLYNSSLIIANTCVYGHSMDVNGGGYGQNIAAGMPVDRIAYVITEQFYNGEVNAFQYYGQPVPDLTTFHTYGHFTQVVWAGTSSVACASVDCTKKGLANTAANVPKIFHVCNYGPAGNVIGLFDTNVLPSRNLPTIHG